MKSSNKIDMTKGSIMKLVLLFALPICAGNILQQLYNTVDTLVIGNFCGSLSLAAVGTSAQPVEMLLCIFLGTLGNMGYNMNAGILRGVGDSKSTLLFLVISCIVNIVLDLIFVAVFRMDVTGAALATVIAMFSSWIFSILYIQKKYPHLQFTLFPKHMDKSILNQIVRIGLPLGLNNSVYSVGHIVMQSLINAQGSTFMAACAVATKLTGISNVAISSLSSAATTFSGQNLGAENYKRLKQGGQRIPFISGLITACAGITFTIFCRPILGFFTDDAAVLNLAVTYIHVVLPFTWMYAVFNGIICFVNGMGEIKYTTVVNILMLWAVRIPTGYMIAYFINGTYCMASIPISFAFGMTCMLAYFGTKKWQNICRLATSS